MEHWKRQPSTQDLLPMVEQWYREPTGQRVLQAEQELIEVNGEKFLQFYGMSSDTAMTKHKGGVAEYRASEGKTVRIPYRGDVTGTLQDVLGGVRSACTYVGARQLKELPKRTTFVRVTQQINNIFGTS